MASDTKYVKYQGINTVAKLSTIMFKNSNFIFPCKSLFSECKTNGNSFACIPAEKWTLAICNFYWKVLGRSLWPWSRLASHAHNLTSHCYLVFIAWGRTC